MGDIGIGHQYKKISFFFSVAGFGSIPPPLFQLQWEEPSCHTEGRNTKKEEGEVASFCHAA
jgi:hypothetical protein